MTRKEQNKILDAKIESNVNQYKVDRMNAEISAFSSGDLNKYEFLKRINLNYKPNALDKARFEFSPLDKTFSTGLDKTAQDYQEEGIIKSLKDIRDGLRGVNRRANDNRRNDEFDNMFDDVSFDDNENDNGSFDDDGHLMIMIMIMIHLMMMMMMMMMMMIMTMIMVQILIKNIIVCCVHIFN